MNRVNGINGDTKAVSPGERKKVTEVKHANDGDIHIEGTMGGIKIRWERKEGASYVVPIVQEKSLDGEWRHIGLLQKITIELSEEDMIPKVTMEKVVV